MTIEEIIGQIVEELTNKPTRVVTDDNKAFMEIKYELVNPRENGSREIGVAEFILCTNKVYQFVKNSYVEITEEQIQQISVNHWNNIIGMLIANRLIRLRPSIARKNLKVITNENYKKTA